MIVGDFNAKDLTWGYKKPDKKGMQVKEAADMYGCTLITDDSTPTRLGNSVSSDTCPDLTYIRGTDKAVWENLLENLAAITTS